MGYIIQNLSEQSIRKLLTLGSGLHSVVLQTKLDDSKDAFALPWDIEILQELEKNDLLTGEIMGDPMKLDKFTNYFNSLHPQSHKRFVSGDGSYSDKPSESTVKYYEEKTIPLSQLSQKDIDKIRHYDVRLSESGKKAFEIIIKVISEQINHD